MVRPSSPDWVDLQGVDGHRHPGPPARQALVGQLPVLTPIGGLLDAPGAVRPGVDRVWVCRVNGQGEDLFK